MSKSSLPTPTFQSGEAYTPRFELWMNGIIWQGIYNVMNSYSTTEMESLQSMGAGKASTHAPEDMFIGRVRILEDTVLAIQEADTKYEKDVERKNDEDDFEHAHRAFRAILRFLNRKGHIRFKPPRDFADD